MLACARLGEGRVAAIAASRTDAGVHAHGQVARIDTRRDWQPAALCRMLDGQLPSDCACRAVARVADDWQPTHLAAAKTYRYHLDRSQPRDPLLAPFSWRPPGPPLEPDRLRSALALLPGQHDCRAFRRRGDHRDDYHIDLQQAVCTITATTAAIDLRADRFAYRLARSLIGAVIAVARGSLAPDSLRAALSGEATPACRHQAPAKGLSLLSVHYPPPYQPHWE